MIKPSKVLLNLSVGSITSLPVRYSPKMSKPVGISSYKERPRRRKENRKQMSKVKSARNSTVLLDLPGSQLTAVSQDQQISPEPQVHTDSPETADVQFEMLPIYPSPVKPISYSSKFQSLVSDSEFLETVLQQLINHTVKEIHTIDTSRGKFTDAFIYSADNHILSFRSYGEVHYIPIPFIVGIEIWPDEFSENNDSPQWEDERNKELSAINSDPMSNFFTSLLGSTIDFDTLAEQLNDVTDVTVAKVHGGLGYLTGARVHHIVRLLFVSDVSNIRAKA